MLRGTALESLLDARVDVRAAASKSRRCCWPASQAPRQSQNHVTTTGSADEHDVSAGGCAVGGIDPAMDDWVPHGSDRRFTVDLGGQGEDGGSRTARKSSTSTEPSSVILRFPASCKPERRYFR